MHVAKGLEPVAGVCEKPCEGRRVCSGCAYAAHSALGHKVKELGEVE